jgi:hypothetical protein
MADSNELENNIVYKLIVLNNLEEKYNWEELA